MFTSRCGESLVVAVFRLYICLVQTIVATGPRSGKVRKNCFSSAYFFSKPARILEPRPRLQLYVQSVFEINLSDHCLRRCSF